MTALLLSDETTITEGCYWKRKAKENQRHQEPVVANLFLMLGRLIGFPSKSRGFVSRQVALHVLSRSKTNHEHNGGSHE